MTLDTRVKQYVFRLKMVRNVLMASFQIIAKGAFVKKSLMFLTGVIAAAALTACGDNSTPASTPAPTTPTTPVAADPVDKYVGTWLLPSQYTSVCQPSPSSAAITQKDVSAVLTKVDSTTLSASANIDVFQNSNCSGTPTRATEAVFTYKITGQSTVAGTSVDNTLVTIPGAGTTAQTGKTNLYINSEGKLCGATKGSYGSGFTGTSYPQTLAIQTECLAKGN